jgi:hypothetical protein
VTGPGEINHEYFEELGALAALGQISAAEFKELQVHLSSCRPCRTRQTEFVEILHEHLPLLATPTESTEGAETILQHAADFRRRFLKRASQEGLRFSGEAIGKSRAIAWFGKWRLEAIEWAWRPGRLAYGLALLSLCAGVWILGLRLNQANSKYSAASSEMVKLNVEIGRLNSLVNLVRAGVAGPPQNVLGGPSTGIPARSSPEVEKVQAELKEARRNYDQALAQIRSLDEQLDRLQKDTVELAALKSERALPESKASSIQRLHETEAALQQANEEIARLRQEHSVQMASMSSQQAQIRELNDKLISQKESLERHTDQLATTREIRDLMGARNLHIIDVADVDSRGTRKPFGRVFYTEGKSLVFYAYDLEKKKKSMEKFCFQAWGQVESKTGSVQSLGVFSTDDQTQNRWVLKYDDPSVLARIDSVFVTVEPSGGSMKPKGQQLMYAYLKANPNHP